MLTATPDVLARIEKVRSTVDSLKSDDEKIAALFQLLSFELRFTDKAPARKTLSEIEKRLENVQKEPTRTQMMEAIAYNYGEIGDFDAAVKMMDRITDVSLRAEIRLNIAERFINEKEENEKNGKNTDVEPKFDVVDLLRKAVAGAEEAKDAGLEAIATTVLARELAKQGDLEQAKPLFMAARKKAREIEEIEERNVVALIVRSLIQYDMVPDALAMVETVADEELKQAIFSLAVVSLAQNGKFDEAEKMLATMKEGDIKDSTVIGVAKEYAQKTGDAALPSENLSKKMLALAAQMSSAERKEIFVQNTLPALLDNGKYDVVENLVGLSENAQEIRLTLKLRELESLIEAKNYADAEKLIGTMDDRFKPMATRHLLLAEIRNGADPAAMKDRIAKTLSEEEKQQRDEIQKEFEKAATLNNFEDRMAARYEVMQAQIKLFDLDGARKTVAKMLEDATAPSMEPSKLVTHRLLLARIQTELDDKVAARENLRQLLKYLGELKDVMVLKDLVPPEESRPGAQDDNADVSTPIIALKAPVDEKAVKAQLFVVYVSTADALGKVGDLDDAKVAADRAAALLDETTDPVKKIEGLMLLTQILAEIEN